MGLGKSAVLVFLSSLLVIAGGCGGQSATSATQGTTQAAQAAQPAPTVTLTAQATTITSGSSTTLSWTSTNATGVTIAPGIGAQPPSGSVTVSPAQTTQYTAIATNAAGATANGTVTVTVNAPQPVPAPSTPPPTAPAIQSFTASANNVAPNTPVTLSWTVAGATTVNVDPGFDNQQATGSVQVTPSTTTTYTLTAQDAAGSVNQTLTVTVVPPATGSVNVPTWHYDNNRSGLNAQETALTPSTVKAGSFGKLFSYTVDGYLYAEPLYMSGLTVNGATHNVVFAATEHDTVYAFDADSPGTGAPLWKTSLLAAGQAPYQSANIQPYRGITSTPVIDPSTNTLYVVGFYVDGSGKHIGLHALDITTGAEKPSSPVNVEASVKNASGGTLGMSGACTQRAALLLTNGTLVIGFSACGPGWMVSYDAATLQQKGIFNSSINEAGYGEYGGAGGVWMGGAGPAADANGNIFIATGNGPYGLFGNTMSWGDSVLKLDANMDVLDHFTPDDYAYLQCGDNDLGSGGVLLVPGEDYAVAGGKTGRIFLLKQDALGGETQNDGGAVNEAWFDRSTVFTDSCTDNTGTVLKSQKSHMHFGTPAWFNGSFYSGADGEPVRRFGIANGTITSLAASNAGGKAITFGGYGAQPVVSANGTSAGVVWALDTANALQLAATPGPAVLHAFDATDLHELYNSAQNAGDAAGYAIKFTSPVVANGKVYVGAAHTPDPTDVNATGELDVYGLTGQQ